MSECETIQCRRRPERAMRGGELSGLDGRVSSDGVGERRSEWLGQRPCLGRSRACADHKPR